MHIIEEELRLGLDNFIFDFKFNPAHASLPTIPILGNISLQP